ncbi:MAG: hypothetical protein J6Z46_00390 [Lachnospiraceae bacterium]|nr:hypothetical protein [Lachnospiraceae bacterium]
MAKRRSVAPVYSMCVQPSFRIGTNNEDVAPNFAPITWVSATCEKSGEYLPVIYSGRYHSLGGSLGKIGDHLKEI